MASILVKKNGHVAYVEYGGAKTPDKQMALVLQVEDPFAMAAHLTKEILAEVCDATSAALDCLPT